MVDITSPFELDSNLGIESDYFERISPVRSLDNSSGPIEFNLEPSPLHLTDLSQSYLSISVKVKRDGNAVEHCLSLTPSQITDPSTINFSATTGAGAPGDDTALSCVNNLMHALFSQVSLYLNNVLVERISDYNFTSYVQTLLGFDKEAKKSAIQHLFGYYDDQPGKFQDKANTAHRERIKHLLLNGKECHMKARLQLGVMEMGRYIPNHMSIKLVLHKKNAQFPLIFTDTSTNKPDGDYSIEITDAQFEVRRLGVLPSILKDYEAKLTRELGQFSFVKTECKAFTFSANQSDITLDNIFSGDIPESILICMLPNKTYHGDLYKNPYEFKHYDMTKAMLQANKGIFLNELFTPLLAEKPLCGIIPCPHHQLQCCEE